MFHLASPAEETPEIVALPPHELPELQEADLLHLDAGIGLDTPEKIGAAPRSEAMSLGGVPEKADTVPHAGIINTKVRPVQKRQYRSERYGSLARPGTAEGACPDMPSRTGALCLTDCDFRAKIARDKIQSCPENFSACLTPKAANKLRIITTPRWI
jgi:hypothetical protein